MNGPTLTGKRYYIDFVLIPRLVAQAPGAIYTNLMQGKMPEFLTTVFNDVYENLKSFTKDQFNVEIYKDSFSTIFYTTLPTEHEGSMVYCNAYGFAFTQQGDTIATAMFTVETGDAMCAKMSGMHVDHDTYMLCGFSDTLTHLNFGHAFTTNEENAKKMLEIVRPKYNIVEI